MRKPRNRSESQQLDLYPQMMECPECKEALKEKYHKQRWIIQLKEQVKVVSHFLECGSEDCKMREAVYRPEQEDAMALRGYNFGLDVVARIGELRYRDNLTITKIKEQLQTQYQLKISVKEVELLSEVFFSTCDNSSQ